MNNADRVTIGDLKINSLRSKFEMLREIVQGKLDILLISETKVDPSFPSSQFATDVLVFHFDLTEIVQEAALCCLLKKKSHQNS